MRWLCIILYINSICGFSQKILNVHYYSLFGKHKTHQFYNNQVLHYKLKGQFRYHANKVVNMQDSLILFDNEKTIKLNDIKALKVPGIKLNYILYNSALGFLESEVFYHFMFNLSGMQKFKSLNDNALIMPKNKKLLIAQSSNLKY